MVNNNWTVEQTRELFALCAKARKNGESLSDAFATVAEHTSRSVNSVRNYYYAQAKTFELVPEVADKLGIATSEIKRERFVPFTEAEVRTLIEHVLISKGRGISVRRAINELAGGDPKTALRYQNKYRSALRARRKLVESVVSDLASRHMPYVDPYARSESDNFARLTEYIAALDGSRVGKFLDLIEKLT